MHLSALRAVYLKEAKTCLNFQSNTATVQERMVHPDSENFCLNWNDFVKNVTSSFVDLRRDQEFSDVTLACGDGQRIEAHKVVLASGSLVFKDLLRQSQNKSSHPLVYMRGLKTSDLNLIVDFLYHGEVSVHQDKLNEFLALAEELQLKGLSGDGLVGSQPSQVQQQKGEDQHFSAQNPVKAKVKTRTPFIAKPANSNEEQALSLFEDGKTKPKVSFRDGSTELDQQIDSMMERIEGAWTCKVCGKKDQLNKSNIKKHIEGIHLEGSAYSCDFCGTIARSKNGLQSHIFRNHRN